MYLCSRVAVYPRIPVAVGPLVALKISRAGNLAGLTFFNCLNVLHVVKIDFELPGYRIVY